MTLWAVSQPLKCSGISVTGLTHQKQSQGLQRRHTQYSTFHVLLRFTTISRKPTASQTGKDNGANLLLSGLTSASVKYVKFCGWWKIGVQQAQVRKRCLAVSHGRDAKEHLRHFQDEIVAGSLWFAFSWCKYYVVNTEGKKNTKYILNYFLGVRRLRCLNREILKMC